MDLYLEALEDLSNANPAFANAISLIKAGVQKNTAKVAEAPKPAVAKEETKTEDQAQRPGQSRANQQLYSNSTKCCVTKN